MGECLRQGMWRTSNNLYSVVSFVLPLGEHVDWLHGIFLFVESPEHLPCTNLSRLTIRWEGLLNEVTHRDRLGLCFTIVVSG